MHGRAVIHEGTGRRRRWTAEEKGRIVALTLAPGAGRRAPLFPTSRGNTVRTRIAPLQ